MNAYQSKHQALVKISGFTMGRIGLATRLTVKKAQELFAFNTIKKHLHQTYCANCTHFYQFFSNIFNDFVFITGLIGSSVRGTKSHVLTSQPLHVCVCVCVCACVRACVRACSVRACVLGRPTTPIL